jgi:Ca2+-binding EF-hand superfamily protein
MHGRLLLIALLAICVSAERAYEKDEKWKHIFGAIDTDTSGYLEKKEQNVLAKQMAKASEEKQTTKQMKIAVRAMDLDHDGKLSPEEFSAAWQASEPSTEDTWKEVFSANDDDKSGVLEKKEQKKLAEMMAAASKKDPEQMTALLLAMDANGDGKIDADEFVKGWKGEVTKEGMLDVLFPGEEIEYKAADGTMKRMTKEQMMAQMEEQEEHMNAMGMGGGADGSGGGGSVGGQVPRTSKGSLKREEVAEKNPQVIIHPPTYPPLTLSSTSNSYKYGALIRPIAPPTHHNGRVCSKRVKAGWRSGTGSYDGRADHKGPG